MKDLSNVIDECVTFITGNPKVGRNESSNLKVIIKELIFLLILLPFSDLTFILSPPNNSRFPNCGSKDSAKSPSHILKKKEEFFGKLSQGLWDGSWLLKDILHHIISLALNGASTINL